MCEEKKCIDCEFYDDESPYFIGDGYYDPYAFCAYQYDKYPKLKSCYPKDKACINFKPKEKPHE